VNWQEIRRILDGPGDAKMKAIRFFPVALLLAAPAQAEKLTFDHRLHPPLKQVLDSGNRAMVAYDDRNPRYVIDRIAVTGKSAEQWTEALEIIARTPTRQVKSAADWLAELRGRADRTCPNRVAVIAQDDNSVTVERHSPNCPAERAPNALYRIVAGKRSLFLLSVLSKRELAGPDRRQWLALLASAHLE
jgi:hypothetical protein